MHMTLEWIETLKQHSAPRKSDVKRKNLSVCERRVLNVLIMLHADISPQLISQKIIGTLTGGMTQSSISLRLAALEHKGYVIVSKPGRTNLITVIKRPPLIKQSTLN